MPLFTILATAVVSATPTVMVLISVVGILLTALVSIGTMVSRSNSQKLNTILSTLGIQGNELAAFHEWKRSVDRQFGEHREEHQRLWKGVSDAKRIRAAFRPE